MITRTDILNHLIAEANPSNYLEIGYGEGDNFKKIKIAEKVSVDPYNEGATFQMTSDQFFKQNKEKFDLIFIDGDHSYGQVKKDFENALKVLNKGGAIVLHDTAPKDREYSSLDWCGEPYKLISELANSNRLLKWYTVPEDHGVCVVKKTSIKERHKPSGIEVKSWEDWNNNKDAIMNFKQINIDPDQK